jgi:malate/lactate dehydrogenase
VTANVRKAKYGIARVIDMSMDEKEVHLLKKSGETLKNIISKLDDYM